MGSNAPDALDNEKPQHWCYLDAYWLDRYPVTCCQYQSFIAADGYRDRQWWSAAGWQWVQAGQIQQPLYWSDALAGSDRPVCGVSYYEAEAYARFAGKRLPTEAEWEKAASWDPNHQRSRPYPWGDELPDARRCNCDGIAGWTASVQAYPTGASASGAWDMLGNVWEWTATCFGGYIGFQCYPYRGYSQAYFDGEHYVLKGGSWATRPQAMRNSFRNWYYPDMRQMFAGFRCARDPD
ncbi:MAG: ergothioneine biosynthesis protein EgtB [Coleofasciculaceae cyanobacterium SM2_3_26]|nr:ergothioneine biosynthesis protein EgtB [Coleofasciculaceae cyanobacterium SM2_3_26]